MPNKKMIDIKKKEMETRMNTIHRGPGSSASHDLHALHDNRDGVTQDVWYNDEYDWASQSSNVQMANNISHNNINDVHDDMAEIVNESNYQEWSQLQVYNWLKMNLVKNGIKNAMIESFLNEFDDKGIAGHTLSELKNNQHMIDQLKSDFSKQNQAFGIWMLVKNAIISVGDSTLTQKESE